MASAEASPGSVEGPLENVRVVFLRDPSGRRVEVSDMEVVKQPFKVPSPLEPGAVVVANLVLSLDPYMRGRMNTQAKSYFPPFKLGDVLETRAVARVVVGEREGIKPGDLVVAYQVGWEKYSLVGPGTLLFKVDPDLPYSPTLYLGLLGVTGATAYRGLELCQATAGETIFVSGATGAVGLAAGKIAKIKGLRVIGSAGTEEKVRFLKEKFGFDDAFCYKTAAQGAGGIEAALQELAPDGIDCYFDNVGGAHLDAALASLKPRGRVAACGMISQYNGETYPFKNTPSIVFKELKVEGFIIVAQLMDKKWMQEFQADVAKWLGEKKIMDTEHVVEGLEKAPEAFVGLFGGVNVGKLLVKV